LQFFNHLELKEGLLDKCHGFDERSAVMPLLWRQFNIIETNQKLIFNTAFKAYKFD